MPRGGSRPGAGRKKGSGIWKGVKTKSVRLPEVFAEKETQKELRKVFDQCSLENDRDTFYARLGKLVRKIIRLQAGDNPEYSPQEIRQYRGAVHAGIGVTFLTDDTPELVDLNQLFVKNPNNAFIAQVAGESMIDVGIYDGDLLIVEEIEFSEQIANNSIVIAAVDDQVVVKRYTEVQGQIILLSENQESTKKEHNPLEITEEKNFRVYGVVKRVISNPANRLDRSNRRVSS